jgi:hypothetical protein
LPDERRSVFRRLHFKAPAAAVDRLLAQLEAEIAERRIGVVRYGDRERVDAGIERDQLDEIALGLRLELALQRRLVGDRRVDVVEDR